MTKYCQHYYARNCWRGEGGVKEQEKIADILNGCSLRALRRISRFLATVLFKVKSWLKFEPLYQFQTYLPVTLIIGYWNSFHALWAIYISCTPGFATRACNFPFLCLFMIGWFLQKISSRYVFISNIWNFVPNLAPDGVFLLRWIPRSIYNSGHLPCF